MKKIIFTLPVLLWLFSLSACTNYGKEKTFNGVDLYHTKNITDAEADSLGAYLVSAKFADGTEKTVQITKSGETYQFRFVAKQGVLKDTAILKTLKLFATVLSSAVFKGAPVELQLCDDQMKTLKVFASDDIGKEKTYNGAELFHTKNVTDTEADTLGKFMISSKFTDGEEKTVQLSKSGNTYQFRFVVRAGIANDTSYIQNAKSYASDISAKVFHNAPVEIHFCDDYFNTQRVVPMK